MGIIASKKKAKRAQENTSDTDINQNHDIETVELTDDLPEKEVSPPKSDVPITEAEKLRNIYKHEQTQLKTSAKTENTFVKSELNEPAENPVIVQDSEQKTATDSGELSDICTQISRKDETQTNNKDMEPKRISPPRGVGLNIKQIRSSPRPPKLPGIGMSREIHGSLITNTVSKHCPDLLQQPKDGDIGLKPLSQGKLGEKNKVRNELEKQGILTTEARAASEQVDPKQEGIISELRQIGIAQKLTADDVYIMSPGLPKRRPPPRLNHLAPLEKESAKTDDKPTNTEIGETKDSVDVLNDTKPCIKKDADEKQGTEPNAVEKKTETDSEYFGTIGVENVGDAEKLKLKLFDVDML